MSWAWPRPGPFLQVPGSVVYCLMSVNRVTLNVSEAPERVAMPNAAGRCRPLLANGETGRKRISDTSLDAMRIALNMHGLSGQDERSAGSDKSLNVARPRKQRTVESDTGPVSAQPKDRQASMASVIPRFGFFDWSSYLKEIDASAVPVNYFTHVPLEIQTDCQSARAHPHNPLPSSFKPDQCMEGIDPHRESLFCALKVAEVMGRRLRLRFIGYPEKYDFWTTVDSPFLFPVGWCAQNKRRLQPPKGYCLERDQFDWDTFMSREKLTAVPRHLFRVPWDCSLTDTSAHTFCIGCKLEAVDKRNPGIACVATVKDIIGDYILIHFDGWDCSFDQWAHVSSELLHPVGYCEDQELTLSIPSDWSTRITGFTWKQYLKETNSKAVPKEAFVKASKAISHSSRLQPGQRLEAVDKRCPQLIRVASIVSVEPSGFVTIGYDGWQDKYNVLLEASSPDLLPAGYCQATGHPLQPPPGHESDTELNGAIGDAHSNSSTSSVSTIQLTNCPTSGCKGYGHAKGPRYSTHQRVSGCPYADVNLKRDLIRPHERFTMSNATSPTPDSTSLLPQMPKLEQAVPASVHSTALPDILSGPCLSPDSSVKNDPFVLSRANSPVLPIVNPAVCSADVTPTCCHKSMSAVSATVSRISGIHNSLPPAAVCYSSISQTPVTLDNTSPASTSVPCHLTHTLLPLDLSVERDTRRFISQGGNSDPFVLKSIKPTKSKRTNENGACEENGKYVSAMANSADLNPTKGNCLSTLSTEATHNCVDTFDISSSAAIFPDSVPNKPATTGTKRANSEYPKLPKQEPKPRLSQMVNVANEYARQQQLFGLAALPMKRKRGRPRKYTTLGMFHAPPHNSRAVQLPSVSSGRNSLPGIPFSDSSSTFGLQQTHTTTGATAPVMMNSPVMPTFSIYTPLTVGASLPGLYSAGLLFPSTSIPVHGTDQVQIAQTSSPITWNADSSSPGCTLANNTSGPHSSGTEPAIARSPNAFDSSAQLPLGTLQSTYISEVPAVQTTAFSCELYASNNLPAGLEPATSRFESVSNKLADPSSSVALNKFPDSTSFPNWFSDPLTRSCVPMHSATAAFCLPQQMCLDPRVSSFPLNADTYRPHNLMGMTSNSDPYAVSNELDLMARLLPQASAALRASKLAGLPGPHSWTVEMVRNFVNTLPGCKTFASKFTENEIDGAALLCLEQHDLMHVLGMKLGPAVKIAGAIQTLRRNVMAIPTAELESHYSDLMAAATSCFASACQSRDSATDTPSPGEQVEGNRCNTGKERSTSSRSPSLQTSSTMPKVTCTSETLPT
ncbi:unnamed protein product [Dicrocoelium dendriticum]|nr:unnamed protein product [Dicrocoelium dendriticum]